MTLYAKWAEIEKEPIEDNGLKWNPFVDVKEKDWFHDAVKEAYLNGLLKGTSENTFSPHFEITRGMLVTILYRMENEPPAPKLNFTDVESGKYYTEAIAWANANGIVNGISEEHYIPNHQITREQMAAILYRYAQFKGYDVSVGENTNILSYTDFAAISEYAIPAMQWACGAGIIKGKSEGILAPDDTATRAEAAAILTRFIESNMK